MFNKKFTSAVFLLCCVLARALAAPQPNTAYFKVLSTNDGLPDNSVNDITEDEYGFIWAATWNGLARFDGKYVTSYRHAEGVPGTISNNMVRCVLADEGGLWAGSDNGLDFMRYSDSRFYPSFYIDVDGDEMQPLDKRVSHILKSGTDIFIVTVDGDIMRLETLLSAADRSRNVFRMLPRPRSRRYVDLQPFRGGRLLALSNEGVTLLSPDGADEVCHNRVPSYFDTNMNIYCDMASGRVTVGGGIGTATAEYTIDSAGRLSRIREEVPYGSLMSVAAGENVTYYGTDGKGLFIRQDNELVQFTPENSSLPCDAIYKVFSDSRNNLWIGSYRHGLCMLSHQLNTYAVNDMKSGTLCYDIVTAVVPDGNLLYLGLDGGGLEVLDRSDGSYRIYDTANSGLPADNVISLLKDGTQLWAAVYSAGLVLFDTQSHNFTTYKVDTRLEPGNKIWVLADDGMGNIWVGGNSLTVFNKDKRVFEAVEDCEGVNVMSIASDGESMWVATRHNGVMQIDKRKRRVVERFSDSPTTGGVRLPSHRASFVFVDSRRNLWIALDNSSLCRMSLSQDAPVAEYDLSDGHGRAKVLSMVEDGHGSMLIGTDRGLMKYNPTRDNIISLSDERMPRTFTFNAVARHGDVAYMGTTQGLLCYPLGAPVPSLAMPRTVFTGIDILGSDGETLPLFCTGDSIVELTNAQNFFRVNFSVPEMSSPGQIRFECMLEGLEPAWRDVSDVRWATYTNVPAGNYRMLVRHSLPDGSWSEPAALGIKVRPAWYASTGMLFTWTLLGLALVWLILYFWHKYARNREKTHCAELERDSATRLNEAKLDFYASITHELRTPCFLISAQIEEMYDSGRQSVPVSSLTGIYRNSAKLNKLISHIIDFRKTDTGHLTLNARRIDLVALLGELAIDYEQLCRQKSLTFNFRHDQPPIEAAVDPDKVELIVTNLISNAYKYTPKNGSVSLELHDAGEAVEILVTDNGIGIIDKLQSTIFEPFVRTERGQKVSSGDGLGLAFVKELVELHRGSITVDSQVNVGSCFKVILPKQQANVSNDSEPLPDKTMPKPELLKPAVVEEVPTDSISDPTSTRSILIIDDNHDVLSVLSHAFESGYRVTRMSDAREAVELARKGGFDVVITDLMMPDFDGHQVLRELKSDPRTRDIKVVVFSALTSESDMLQAFDEGADAYLTKPTPVKVLMRQVERLFESSVLATPSATPAGTYNREEQKFLLECRRIIDECMTDENFGIGMLAQRLAMSHSALYKKIRGMTGMSLIDFINEYRVYKAVQLFRDGNTNVQSVAEMCGFRDVKTFRETFKRKMQMPPKQYILSLRGGG